MKIYRFIKNSLLSLFAKTTVGARILLIKDDQILLVKHTYMPGWYTVGGGVDKGESPVQTIKRELQEEVGVTLTSQPTLFSVYHSNFEKRDDYIVLYLGKDFEQVEVHSNEISEQQWFALDNLPVDVTPATRRRIDEYLGVISISDKW